LAALAQQRTSKKKKSEVPQFLRKSSLRAALAHGKQSPDKTLQYWFRFSVLQKQGLRDSARSIGAPSYQGGVVQDRPLPALLPDKTGAKTPLAYVVYLLAFSSNLDDARSAKNALQLLNLLRLNTFKQGLSSIDLYFLGRVIYGDELTFLGHRSNAPDTLALRISCFLLIAEDLVRFSAPVFLGFLAKQSGKDSGEIRFHHTRRSPASEESGFRAKESEENIAWQSYSESSVWASELGLRSEKSVSNAANADLSVRVLKELQVSRKMAEARGTSLPAYEEHCLEKFGGDNSANSDSGRRSYVFLCVVVGAMHSQLKTAEWEFGLEEIRFSDYFANAEIPGSVLQAYGRDGVLNGILQAFAAASKKTTVADLVPSIAKYLAARFLKNVPTNGQTTNEGDDATMSGRDSAAAVGSRKQLREVIRAKDVQFRLPPRSSITLLEKDYRARSEGDEVDLSEGNSPEKFKQQLRAELGKDFAQPRTLAFISALRLPMKPWEFSSRPDGPGPRNVSTDDRGEQGQRGGDSILRGWGDTESVDRLRDTLVASKWPQIISLLDATKFEPYSGDLQYVSALKEDRIAATSMLVIDSGPSALYNAPKSYGSQKKVGCSLFSEGDRLFLKREPKARSTNVDVIERPLSYRDCRKAAQEALFKGRSPSSPKQNASDDSEEDVFVSLADVIALIGSFDDPGGAAVGGPNTTAGNVSQFSARKDPFLAPLESGDFFEKSFPLHKFGNANLLRDSWTARLEYLRPTTLGMNVDEGPFLPLLQVLQLINQLSTEFGSSGNPRGPAAKTIKGKLKQLRDLSHETKGLERVLEVCDAPGMTGIDSFCRDMKVENILLPLRLTHLLSKCAVQWSGAPHLNERGREMLERLNPMFWVSQALNPGGGAEDPPPDGGVAAPPADAQDLPLQLRSFVSEVDVAAWEKVDWETVLNWWQEASNLWKMRKKAALENAEKAAADEMVSKLNARFGPTTSKMASLARITDWAIDESATRAIIDGVLEEEGQPMKNPASDWSDSHSLILWTWHKGAKCTATTGDEQKPGLQEKCAAEGDSGPIDVIDPTYTGPDEPNFGAFFLHNSDGVDFSIQQKLLNPFESVTTSTGNPGRRLRFRVDSDSEGYRETGDDVWAKTHKKEMGPCLCIDWAFRDGAGPRRGGVTGAHRFAWGTSVEELARAFVFQSASRRAAELDKEPFKIKYLGRTYSVEGPDGKMKLVPDDESSSSTGAYSGNAHTPPQNAEAHPFTTAAEGLRAVAKARALPFDVSRRFWHAYLAYVVHEGCAADDDDASGSSSARPAFLEVEKSLPENREVDESWSDEKDGQPRQKATSVGIQSPDHKSEGETKESPFLSISSTSKVTTAPQFSHHSFLEVQAVGSSVGPPRSELDCCVAVSLPDDTSAARSGSLTHYKTLIEMYNSDKNTQGVTQIPPLQKLINACEGGEDEKTRKYTFQAILADLLYPHGQFSSDLARTASNQTSASEKHLPPRAARVQILTALLLEKFGEQQNERKILNMRLPSTNQTREKKVTIVDC